MNYWLPYGLDYNQATNRTWHKVRFKKIINTFKSLSTYPNVLMWAFGNENNLNRGPLSLAQLFAYYQEAINEAKRPETRARRVERTIQALIDRASGG
jgi:beta-galactosidase/beta-glucuronidase